MSEILERLVSPDDGYRSRANGRFLPIETDAIREEYKRRGLTHTNNLKLYLTENPKPEAMPGYPDAYDYRHRIFGHIIETFRIDYPDIWGKVQESFVVKNAAEREYLHMQMYGYFQADEYGEFAEECGWTFIQATSEAYDVLAPMLEAADFDPLEVCI